MEQQLKIYYKKYKREILPAALLGAGIILITNVIMPQFTGILDLREDISTQQETNEGLRDSQVVLNSIDNVQLDEDYNLVLEALPPAKQIGAMYSSLNSAANSSSVTIGSLNLQVGSVYESDGNQTSSRAIEGVPFLEMLVRVNGNSSTDTTRFAEILYESLPVVEINTIAATDSDGRYGVDFFFKPINTDSFQAQTRIQSLTADQQELLTTLRSWRE